jgi:hypothetical protein
MARDARHVPSCPCMALSKINAVPPLSRVQRQYFLSHRLPKAWAVRNAGDEMHVWQPVWSTVVRPSTPRASRSILRHGVATAPIRWFFYNPCFRCAPPTGQLRDLVHQFAFCRRSAKNGQRVPVESWQAVNCALRDAGPAQRNNLRRPTNLAWSDFSSPQERAELNPDGRANRAEKSGRGLITPKSC